MSHLDKILAKSNPEESLETHTLNVINVWVQLRERYNEIIQDEEFWQNSFLAVAYHDFGKICNQFQDVIQGRKATTNNQNRVRHEFFSGMLLFLSNPQYFHQNVESLSAVFSHHKPWNDEGFLNEVSRNLTIPFQLDQNVIDEFENLVNKKTKELCLEEFKNPNTEKINISYNSLYCLFKKGFYDQISKEDFLNTSNRLKYLRYKAILNICDWTASGHLELEKGLKFSVESLKVTICRKLEKEGKIEIARNFKFRRFQTESQTTENVLAIAPTGSGKTEASLLWASQKEDWERIIYLLPTRVTSNAIYQRLGEYFGFNYTQLIHSSARQYIKEQVDGEYDRKRYFRDKTFFKNINVCTIDQLLTMGFNLGYWEVKTFHLINAKVIIDEIHLYSPYTLGLVISTIKYLKENFGTKFYIMTATMPHKLRQLLQETLGEVKLIQDRELLDQARNQFEARGSLLQENTKEIRESLNQKKKVLVVVNTVDQAIALFEELKGYAEENNLKAICYHSRFIIKDRSKKEKEIFELDKSNTGGLLIATQVVEVSLDIDFDILYTENAPIDAIIQRAGRVNRKRTKQDSKVLIFQHSEISEKYVYQVENVLSKTFEEFSKKGGERLTEQELSQLVDKVYEDIDIVTNASYKDGLEKHLDIQIHQYFIKDLTSDAKVFTREGLDTVSVIPSQFEEELLIEKEKKNLKDGDFIDLLTNHEVSIRRRKLDYVKSSKGPFGFIFLDCDYDFETGLKFKKEETNKAPTY